MRTHTPMHLLLSELDKTIALAQAMRDDPALAGTVTAIAGACADSIKEGGKVLFCGNGGSAADSQHLAAELVGKLMFDRPGLPAIALTTDTSALTAIGNDYGFERVFARQVDTDTPDDDEIDEHGTVIIAGLGRFGQVVNRMLLLNGHRTVVLDYHNELISELRNFGVKGYFGDPSRPELLVAAGIRDARVLVVAVDDRDKAIRMVDHVSREYPHVHVVARAFDHEHVYRLYAAGAQDIVRETFDSSVRAGRYALQSLGHHPFEVERAARAFVKKDRHHLAELARLWDPELSAAENEAYAERAREINLEVNEALMSGRSAARDETARAWTPPPKGGSVSAEQAERDREKRGTAAE